MMNLRLVSMLTMLSMVLSKIIYKEVVDYGKGL